MTETDNPTDATDKPDDTPQPKLQIVLDVYEDGNVAMNPMFNDLQSNLMVLAKAMTYCAEMFVLQAKAEAEEKKGSKIITLH